MLCEMCLKYHSFGKDGFEVESLYKREKKESKRKECGGDNCSGIFSFSHFFGSGLPVLLKAFNL